MAFLSDPTHTWATCRSFLALKKVCASPHRHQVTSPPNFRSRSSLEIAMAPLHDISNTKGLSII